MDANAIRVNMQLYNQFRSRGLGPVEAMAAAATALNEHAAAEQRAEEATAEVLASALLSNQQLRPWLRVVGIDPSQLDPPDVAALRKVLNPKNLLEHAEAPYDQLELVENGCIWHLAAQHGRTDVFEYLDSSGLLYALPVAKLYGTPAPLGTVRTVACCTALCVALRHAQEETARWLMRAGADVGAGNAYRDGCYFPTVFHIACGTCSEDLIAELFALVPREHLTLAAETFNYGCYATPLQCALKENPKPVAAARRLILLGVPCVLGLGVPKEIVGKRGEEETDRHLEVPCYGPPIVPERQVMRSCSIRISQSGKRLDHTHSAGTLG